MVERKQSKEEEDLEQFERLRIRQLSTQNTLYRAPSIIHEYQNINMVPKLPKSTESVKLVFKDGKECELPIYQPTEGYPCIDIQNLHKLTGHFTYDPGFMCTGSCSSTITYIDGDKGQLMYRGYNVKDLAENCTYMEVCYLLIYGQLPSRQNLLKFEDLVKSEMMIHEKLVNFYQGFNYDAHPMAIMCGVVGALSAFYHDDIDIYTKDANEHDRVLVRLIAKMPTIAAAAYRTSIGLPIVQAKKKYSYIENFLYMMFANPQDEEFKMDPRIIRAFEADHEQNASTSTVRITGSSFANPFACISAGIASLWGPAHGGANESVMRMLETIGSEENIPSFLAKVKDKSSGLRLMGQLNYYLLTSDRFGHRIYKNYDPRAKIMQEICNDVLEAVGQKNNKFFKLAKALENIALSDEYFIKRKLYPNVDFYTGIIYKALDFPYTMFTVLFACARTVGWICQWREMMSEGLNKIGRPRQLYVGEQSRDFVKLEDRQQATQANVTLEIQKRANITQLPIL